VRERLALANPGTSSIYRVMGNRAAMVVFTADAVRGFLPPLLGRAAGAGPMTIDALMIAPIAGHVTVGRGRGVATLAGALLGNDPAAFAMILPAWVVPTLKKDHGRGVLAACLLFPAARWLLRRGSTRAAVSAFVPLLLIYGRLRGPGWAQTRWTPALAWCRITRDADSPAAGPDAAA
jgi:glycerol-3-phosphate acyltransferase PlsY